MELTSAIPGILHLGPRKAEGVLNDIGPLAAPKALASMPEPSGDRVFEPLKTDAVLASGTGFLTFPTARSSFYGSERFSPRAIDWSRGAPHG